MVNNIPEILHSRKAHTVALVLIMTFLGVFSFGLGRLSVEGEGKVNILECPKTPLNATVAQVKTVSATAVETGQYVASRNGTKYHFPWCSGAQRIKEENKIFFDTREAAEKAGYGPASNCKGL